MDTAGRSHLTFEFHHRAFEHAYQRAGAKLFGHRGDVLHTLGLAQRTHEAGTLGPGAADQSPLGKDYRPGHHAEGDQNEKHDLGDRARLQDEIEYFAADKNYKNE